MADFILNGTTDSGSLDFPKTDQILVPVGADPTRFVEAVDWNSLNQAVVDTRRNILSGTLFGFGFRFAGTGSITPPAGVNLGSLDFLYVRTDGALIQHKKDNTEFVLAAAAANVQFSQYAEIDTLPTPVVLPALTQGSGIVYLRSNGERTAGRRRSQLVVRWGTDNTDTVIAEGPLY